MFRILARAFRPNSLIKALSGAAVLWRFLPDSHSDAATIHQTFYREVWREKVSWRRFTLVLGFVFWAPAFIVLTLYSTSRCGMRVKKETGKGILLQVGEQFWLAIRWAALPPWYYIFEFYDNALRAQAGNYIYRFETKRSLYHMLRDQLTSSETTSALSDKAAFAVRCEAHGVPVIPALATVKRGVFTRLDGARGGMPHQDLFFKHLRGAGGRGAARWIYNKETGNYHGGEGTVLSESDLVEYAQELSKTKSYVIRALATNHPKIADLSPGALSTVRVVTCLDEHGQPEVTHAVFRMASNETVLVDNFHAGGIAASVDLRSGCLGQATDMGLGSRSKWWKSHPQTGALILGRTLPCWNEVKEVACSAHRAFSDQVAIGWDIALVGEGPVLVEGNKGADLDIVQRAYRQPVGPSRLGHLLVFNIGRALEKKYGMAARTVRYGWVPDSEEPVAP